MKFVFKCAFIILEQSRLQKSSNTRAWWGGGMCYSVKGLGVKSEDLTCAGVCVWDINTYLTTSTHPTNDREIRSKSDAFSLMFCASLGKLMVLSQGRKKIWGQSCFLPPPQIWEVSFQLPWPLAKVSTGSPCSRTGDFVWFCLLSSAPLLSVGDSRVSEQ